STVQVTPTTAPQPGRGRAGRRRRRRWPALLLALLVLAGLATVAAVEVPKLNDTTAERPAAPSGVAVPDLTGQALDVAERRLDDLGLNSSRVGGGLFGVVIPSDWDVCEQAPPPGSSARRGSTVRLLVDRPDACSPLPSRVRGHGGRPRRHVRPLPGARDDHDVRQPRLDRIADARRVS